MINWLATISSFTVCLWITCIDLSYQTDIPPIRFEDEPFPAKMWILNSSTITCGQHTPGKFMSPTFTCMDLRVDGHRLAYGYSGGWAVGQRDKRCQQTGGNHEFYQLCRLLMKASGRQNIGVKAVYIPSSSCSYLEDDRKLLQRKGKDFYQFESLGAGWGWTKTLQCMTDL